MKHAPASAAAPSGVVVVDKPKGPTSHDIVAQARRLLKTRHVGHAGTLDPMATGVLVLGVGEGTKLLQWLTADDKSYEAVVRLGIETDTLDAEGSVGREIPLAPELVSMVASGLMPPAIAEAARQEEGRTEQIPPVYSAIKIDGVRAHTLARQGAAPVELAPRPVGVRQIELVGATTDGLFIDVTVRLDVQKGYFVRSFARDLAERLGTVAHLTHLRRLRSGAFAIAEATSPELLSRAMLSSCRDAACRALPVTYLDEAGTRAARFGQPVKVPVPQEGSVPEGPSAWLDAGRKLVAIGQTSLGTGRVLRGFPEEG